MKFLINKILKYLLIGLIGYFLFNCVNYSALLTGNTQNILTNLDLVKQIIMFICGVFFFKFFIKIIFGFIGRY